MDRILLVGGAMLVVGIALAGVFVLLSSYGNSFEMLEDTIVHWLGRA
jgi:hypothetical protein